ncbi:MAG: creatininase family protein, partial [Thermomicrobiales bacterium]|nr:creatininase family protein [Thermomicrobiales bacterium]
MELNRPERFYWGNLSWPELKDAAAREPKPVVVQPIGAMEQHGAHLPLNTDNALVSAVCHRGGERAQGDLLVLPVIPYAFNAHHMDFPGVIAIQWQTVISWLIDVAVSVAHHGFDRMILLSGHGVNPPYLAVAANEVNVRTGALCASCFWSTLAPGIEEILTSPQPGGTGHACELETSAMLAAYGDRVRTELIEDDLGFEQGTLLQMDLRSGTGIHLGEHWWSSFSPAGVAGMASLGTAEKGELLLDRAADGLVALAR